MARQPAHVYERTRIFPNVLRELGLHVLQDVSLLSFDGYP